MGLILEYAEGQTPLNEDEKGGLLIKSITTHSELNEHEQWNIEQALLWLYRKKWSVQELLTEEFIRQLHRKMFDRTWSWAGDFRRTEKNIGVQWVTIPIRLKELLEDTAYWIAHNTYPQDEIAIRFKHRLVNIHCFANGNGRHSRIMAEIIVEMIFRLELFTWNNSVLVKPDEIRKKYIAALREADKGDISHLLAFAKS